MLKESLRMSWQNIRSNKMRTFLTMLGIIIGVTAIIALITTVEGATGEITSQFSALGAGKVSVSVTGTSIKHGLNSEDIAKIAAIDNIAGVDPSVTLSRHIAHEGTLLEDASIEGRSAAYFSGESTAVSSGRALTSMDMDAYSRVCLVDGDIRAALFPNENPIGQEIVISGLTFTVVGVLDDGSDNVVRRALSALNGAASSGTASGFSARGTKAGISSFSGGCGAVCGCSKKEYSTRESCPLALRRCLRRT